MKWPPRVLALSWLALLVLLGTTVLFAYQPLGVINGPLSLSIAALKALIVAAIFMELREHRAPMLAFAAAGVCWLAVLLWLASADFMWRPRLDAGATGLTNPPVSAPP